MIKFTPQWLLFWKKAELLFLGGNESESCTGGAGGQKCGGLHFIQGQVWRHSPPFCDANERVGTMVLLSIIEPEAKSSLFSWLTNRGDKLPGH